MRTASRVGRATSDGERRAALPARRAARAPRAARAKASSCARGSSHQRSSARGQPLGRRSLLQHFGNDGATEHEVGQGDEARRPIHPPPVARPARGRRRRARPPARRHKRGFEDGRARGDPRGVGDASAAARRVDARSHRRARSYGARIARDRAFRGVVSRGDDDVELRPLAAQHARSAPSNSGAMAGASRRARLPGSSATVPPSRRRRAGAAARGAIVDASGWPKYATGKPSER